MKAALIDHDDSFTYNLRSWLSPLFKEVVVKNHREVNFQTKLNEFDLVVLSPGPNSPQSYPHIQDFLNSNGKELPIFGVCLGLQSMVFNSQDSVRPYQPPLHGKTSQLKVLSTSWKKLNQLNVARYHSLACQTSPQSFVTIATTGDDNVPMILESKKFKWLGVQYHPESFLTEQPDLHLQLLTEWLKA